MHVEHINIKFFVRKPELVNLEDFLSVFTQWIQQQACEGLLVDVADYRHVPAGPGVVLIGDEANYSMDCAGNRLGLLYNQKSSIDGSIQDRISRTVRSALLACRRLEEDPLLQGKLSFLGEEILLLVNDRLLAPNTEQTFLRLAPEVRSFFAELFDESDFTLSRDPDPRARFNILVKAAGRLEVSRLLSNMSNQKPA
ncbi:MAG TPA: hypothetical protein VGK99_17510 [Acidobacteriota bacterium]|jgi:hypothetical protein